jgi:choice-of-anchor B domain-containing protein
MFSKLALLSLLGTAAATEPKHCVDDCLRSSAPNDPPLMVKNGNMARKERFWEHMKMDNKMMTGVSQPAAPCVDGMAGEYPCSGVDMQSFVNLKDLGCDGDGSDIWGWTDDEGNEYALATCESGTSFVDVTDALNPVVLGFLPTNTFKSWWFDVKIYKNFAYIGSEARNHGMSVFDLSQLTTLAKEYRSSEAFHVHANTTSSARTTAHVNLGNTLEPTSVYKEFGSSHNIVINEETGYLYAVGTKTCDGGPHIIDVRDPANPTFVGCYSADGYTHDAECVIYKGPDDRYTGHEICFMYNEDTLTIADMTDKENMRMLARHSYDGAVYTHQGSLNADMTHLLLNDELDEEEISGLDGHTRSMIWDVSKLDTPTLIGNFYSSEKAIDHNEYIHNGVSWQSNYCAGLRVLDARSLETGVTKELAYFDVSPECDTAIFMGAWSAFPYFKSGNIIVQSIERGLFVLKPTFELS